MGERVAGQQGRFDIPLEALCGARGVLGGLLATEEGLPVAARMRSEHDSEALAATAASIGLLGSKALASLGKGKLRLAVVDASKLRFLVRRVSMGFLLVVAELETSAGLIAAEMNRAAAALEEAAGPLGELERGNECGEVNDEPDRSPDNQS